MNENYDENCKPMEECCERNTKTVSQIISTTTADGGPSVSYAATYPTTDYYQIGRDEISIRERAIELTIKMFGNDDVEPHNFINTLEWVYTFIRSGKLPLTEQKAISIISNLNGDDVTDQQFIF